MAPQPTVPTCSVSRAGRLRAFFVLIGLVALCLLAFRSPAFAEEAQPDPSDDAPTPRAAMCCSCTCNCRSVQGTSVK